MEATSDPNQRPAAFRKAVGLLTGWILGWQVGELIAHHLAAAPPLEWGPTLVKVLTGDLGASVGWLVGVPLGPAVGLWVGWNLGATVMVMAGTGSGDPPIGLLPIMVFGLALGAALEHTLRHPPGQRPFPLVLEVGIVSILGGVLGWTLGVLLAGALLGGSIGGVAGVAGGALVGVQVHRMYHLGRQEIAE